jgi:hypothetical protein
MPGVAARPPIHTEREQRAEKHVPTNTAESEMSNEMLSIYLTLNLNMSELKKDDLEARNHIHAQAAAMIDKIIDQWGPGISRVDAKWSPP